MKALNNFGNSRKKKKAIVRFHRIRQFFWYLKNNNNAREFILNKMKEKGINFDIDVMLGDEFFAGLTDLMKLESINCILFNHKFFQFVNDTFSIPYGNKTKTKTKNHGQPRTNPGCSTC